MHMIAADRAFKQTGDEDFIEIEGRAADRADSLFFPTQAVYTTLNIHQTVFSTGTGGKSLSFYQLSFDQPGRADRAHLGIAGNAGIGNSLFMGLLPVFPDFFNLSG